MAANLSSLPAHHSRSQAQSSRLLHGDNVIPPPSSLPKLLCCLLPCLKNTRSQRLYNTLIAQSATVLRDGSFLSVDSASVVVGDVLRLRAGDVVPADCEHERAWGGEGGGAEVDGGRLTAIGGLRGVNVGGRVLAGEVVSRGEFLARVTRVGRGTQLAKRIKTKSFPFGDARGGGAREVQLRNLQKRGGQEMGGDDMESEAMLKEEV